MAEKKTNLKPIGKRGAKKPATLDAAKRLKRVLASQGYFQIAAIGKLPNDVTKQLTELCNEDGTLDPATRIKSEKILDAYYDSQKAAVDKTPKATTESK